MHAVPPGGSDALAQLDKGRTYDARGLPTRATWLVKRLVYPSPELILPPSLFSVLGVIDWLLLPRHFLGMAHRPLDEVVREWDPPGRFGVQDDNQYFMGDPRNIKEPY
ncbi:hypothetical protein BC828DRAFT_409550 [Blastocladiella britannica]|nr:hypothetical protein BC828DRAFT_409550 [Blastocladiella britannica]